MARVRMRHLLAPAIVSLLLLMANSSPLNLNEEPADEFMDDQQEATPSQAIYNKTVPSNQNKAGAPGRPTVEQIKKLQAIYVKVLKLMGVLSLCDTDNFDIKRTKIPENWSDQAKAMMVLNKIKKQRLIKKKDLPRFERIMRNCNQIDSLVRQRQEDSLSMESQMSGMNSEDLAKFRRELEQSPLDDFRGRLTETTTAAPVERAPKTPWWRTGLRTPDTTAAPSGSLSSEFLIKTVEDSSRPQDGAPTFIKFF